jgi:hypothetical protein
VRIGEQVERHEFRGPAHGVEVSHAGVRGLMERVAGLEQAGFLPFDLEPDGSLDDVADHGAGVQVQPGGGVRAERDLLRFDPVHGDGGHVDAEHRPPRERRQGDGNGGQDRGAQHEPSRAAYGRDHTPARRAKT